jgi:hypothetical protein
MVGADHTWSRADGTTNASGVVNLLNDIGPGGDRGAQPNAGTFSVDGTGTVTIDTLPGFEGFLSADKKTIVGTSTETDGGTYYHLMIFQISVQTYAASDLVGTPSRGYTDKLQRLLFVASGNALGKPVRGDPAGVEQKREAAISRPPVSRFMKIPCCGGLLASIPRASDGMMLARLRSRTQLNTEVPELRRGIPP